MKRPTITKLQTINALIELKRRDHTDRCAEWRDRLLQAELDLEAELRAVITNPSRVATLVAFVQGPEDDLTHALQLEHDGTITLDAKHLPEVRALRDQLTDIRRANPGYYNETSDRTMLEDKLTGCDPESLLSVPENVATMRALLNGLQLLP